MNGWSFLLQLGLSIGISLMLMHYLSRRQKKPAPRRSGASHSDAKELQELKRLRACSLNLPLAERARPACMDDIIGQQEGIKALRAALCGPNPQHVIIYGPPGVGKTCAARLVLEEAKRAKDSPFTAKSKFVEIDATCVRFDERAIADPLLGSVHDPIYQGAGALGSQGVPQPKPGAVTRAHCGVLFLDEIGELHPVQMNKLLKVLEDRKVNFESAYYSKENTNIPPYIHDIFENGLPADFRLVGATTRSPEELPPAIRSRCMELYFRPLGKEDLMHIAADAAARIGYFTTGKAVELCAMYSASGRDTVNIIQMASGAAYGEGRSEILPRDIEWVAHTCGYALHLEPHLPETARIGVAPGLAVTGMGQGTVLTIECTARRAETGKGTMELTGVVEEEELELRGRRLRRKSTACASIENVQGAFLDRMGVDCRDYDIRVNIPGGVPMDGPSAGIALAAAVMSAITNHALQPLLALTGEIGIHGDVLPVGGVRAKIEAAIRAGAHAVVIPKDNWEDSFLELPIEIHTAEDIAEVMRFAFGMPVELTFSQTEALGASAIS